MKTIRFTLECSVTDDADPHQFVDNFFEALFIFFDLDEDGLEHFGLDGLHSFDNIRFIPETKENP